MLVRIVFGMQCASDLSSELIDCYRKMGPDGLVWDPGNEQVIAFRSIRDFLQQLIDDGYYGSTGAARECVIKTLVNQGAVDETMLGNLVYMVEMGSFDMACYFRWIAKYASENTEAVAVIGEYCQSADGIQSELARSFILETLRMAQSERILRKVNRNLVFTDYLVPRGSVVQVCLWEAHKSPVNFDDPMCFRSHRHVHTKFTSNQFSPFGVGSHHCPMSHYATTLAIIFVSTLSRYHIEGINNGQPFVGKYHWQPSRDFTLRLRPR